MKNRYRLSVIILSLILNTAFILFPPKLPNTAVSVLLMGLAMCAIWAPTVYVVYRGSS